MELKTEAAMNPTSDGYSAKIACKLSGLHYKRVDYLARTNLLQPSIAQAAGTGSDRIYSFRDIVALRVVAELRNAGISLQAIRKVVNLLQTRKPTRSLSSVLLVSDGNAVYEIRAGQLQSVLQKPGQRAFNWILDIGRIEEELKEAIKHKAA